MATSGMRATPSEGRRPAGGAGIAVTGVAAWVRIVSSAIGSLPHALNVPRARSRPAAIIRPSPGEDVDEPEAAVEEEDVGVAAGLDAALPAELVEIGRVGREDPDGRLERQEARADDLPELPQQVLSVAMVSRTSRPAASKTGMLPLLSELTVIRVSGRPRFAKARDNILEADVGIAGSRARARR